MVMRLSAVEVEGGGARGSGSEEAVVRGAGPQEKGDAVRGLLMEGEGTEGGDRGGERAETKMVDLKAQLEGELLLKESWENAYDQTRNHFHLNSRPVVSAVEAGSSGGDNDDAEMIVQAGTRGTDP